MTIDEPAGLFDLTPSQRLAKEIAQALVEEGLVEKAKSQKLELGLAEGSLGPGDWRVFVEVAADRERKCQ